MGSNDPALLERTLEQAKQEYERLLNLRGELDGISCEIAAKLRRDVNGRMSRLLSLLLLYKNGFDAGKYVSFEEQINITKAYYYEALRQASAGWETNENSYFPFIENFLSTLFMCYKELAKRFAVVHGKKITKKDSVEANVLNSLTPLY